MPTGKVARIPLNKNFGFIRDEFTRKDYFFHESDYKGAWNDLVYDFNAHEDVIVNYDIVESLKGPRAANVRRV